MPVPVCCIFFVSPKTHIKRSPNGTKTDRELFWNIYDFWEVKSTRDGARGGQEIGGAPQGGRRALDSPENSIRWLMLFFCRKKANFMRKIWAKDSPQSELRIFGYKRNGEGVESENAETKRYIQSRRGSRPSHAMGAKEQRGTPSPIYGEGQGRRRRRGALSPLLPVAPERCRGPSLSVSKPADLG